ncbi:DNA gyrase inhibitor YacG [Phaeovibrio sulfidiphilus]|uniref:DNA gyrase inhibitor YacG n=1 Tax=Phaeovibrio sulfidiphilus TaxID=1220600 RepID=A0A8J7CFD6_9PROT|nr:DNA gyrase inhibitor YacG [Phaeovibrio sulfidiphilus]MBE1237909.1 DNA gyrase inhibitor YacG [Phaeovibrio sulfidiphilus]
MTQNDSEATPVRVTLAKCPICGEPVEPRYRPFCSRRCADVDLGRWMTGTYRVETEETGDPDEKE